MKDKKWEDRTEEEKQKENDNWENKRNADKKRDDVIAKYSEGNEIISQLIDVAFLAGGILKGDALVKFLKRTVSFIH
jgi:molecular chaperone HtpG